MLLSRRKPQPLPRQSKAKLETRDRWYAQAPVGANECTLYSSGSGEPIGKAARAELLQRLRDGEAITLEMEAVTYIQRDTPNRNFIRFQPGILPTLGASFKGQPFLRDHGQYEMADRGGTILDSKLEHNDDGSKQIRMRLGIVKAWAVESALDGTLDRFSIGWSRTGPVNCSLCSASWLKCDHWPGDEVDGKLCELIYTAAVGTEVSGVNVPAVLGTRIESISQLTAIDSATLADILDGETEIPGVKAMDPKILEALGLPATATADDVAREIAARNDRLTLANASASTASQQLQRLQTEATARESAARESTVNDSVSRLIAAGKLKPGSDVESALRRTATRDMEVFTATVTDMLASGFQVTPVGQPLPVLARDPQPNQQTSIRARLQADPNFEAWRKSAGLTVEQLEKHGANAMELVEQQRLMSGR